MTRRVVLGKYNDGVTIGLRVSLYGVDALTGDSSLPGTFSFDSEWTDIAQIHQVGLSAYQTAYHPPWTSPGVTVDGFAVTWSALGYKPFVEARLLISNVVYDDYFPNGENASFPFGANGKIPDVDPNGLYIQGGASGRQLLSIVYKIAVPSG